MPFLIGLAPKLFAFAPKVVSFLGIGKLYDLFFDDDDEISIIGMVTSVVLLATIGYIVWKKVLK